MSIEVELEISHSLLIPLLGFVGKSSPVESLLAGLVDVIEDKRSIRNHTGHLLERVEAHGSVGVDLRDQSLEIWVLGWLTNILKEVDTLRVELDGFLEGLLLELDISSLFQGSKL